MTYATLQSQSPLTSTSYSDYPDGVMPVGTDEAEAARYAAMYETGTVTDDVSNEFRDAFES